MADADDSARRLRALRLGRLRDDDLVNLEAYLVEHVEDKYPDATHLDTGMLRELLLIDMRCEAAAAARNGVLPVRDELRHLLEILPPERPKHPLTGFYVLWADLYPFAKLHWGEPEPETDKAQLCATQSAAALAGGSAAAADAAQQGVACNAAPELAGAAERRTEPVPASEAAAPTVRSRTRSNVLDPVIRQAIQRATEADSPKAVFAALVCMANERVAPLLGFVDGEGIKYQAESGVEFLTYKNLADRLRRARAR